VNVPQPQNPTRGQEKQVQELQERLRILYLKYQHERRYRLEIAAYLAKKGLRDYPPYCEPILPGRKREADDDPRKAGDASRRRG
jgi:hypothetical protein